MKSAAFSLVLGLLLAVVGCGGGGTNGDAGGGADGPGGSLDGATDKGGGGGSDAGGDSPDGAGGGGGSEAGGDRPDGAGGADAPADGAGGVAEAGGDADAGVPSKFLKIVAGGYHVCALLKTGHLWCWGNNMAGQLGRGTHDGLQNYAPAEVSGITDATDVFVGRYTTCVLNAAGALRCWGLNSERQLGADNTGDATCNIFGGNESCHLAPVTVPLTGTVEKVALGYRSSCALVSQGGGKSVLCWGGNQAGQLGHAPGTGGDVTCSLSTPSGACNATPSTVSLTAPTDLVAGYDYAAAVVSGGAVQVWGDNGYGVLGTGAADFTAHPTPATVPGVTASSLAPSSGSPEHICAVTQAGVQLTCWGSNENGQSGQMTRASAVAPVVVGEPFSAAAVGGRHTCLLAPDKSVECFGDDSSGEVGVDPSTLGSNSDTSTPTKVAGLTNVRALAVGAYHTCALDDADAVWCWGRTTSGETGQMAVSKPYVPGPVMGIGP